jgi:hypothetical protein
MKDEPSRRPSNISISTTREPLSLENSKKCLNLTGACSKIRNYKDFSKSSTPTRAASWITKSFQRSLPKWEVEITLT